MNLIFITITFVLSAKFVEVLTSTIPFNEFEKKYVKSINQQLAIPLEFRSKEHWDDKVQRYVFYSVALFAMRKPLTKR